MGEAVLVLETPKEEKVPPAIRVKGKALNDGALGWITLKGANVKPWSPYYTCKKPTVMDDALESEAAKEGRSMILGDVVELLEGPATAGNLTRIKVRMERANVVG